MLRKNQSTFAPTLTDGSAPVSRVAQWTIRFLLMVPFLLLASGCSQNDSNFLVPPFENRSSGMTPDIGIEFTENYRLGNTDKIKVEVVSHEEFSGEMKIDGILGTVRLPLTREKVKLSGLTIEEGEAAIGNVLKRYLSDSPMVIIEVLQPDSHVFWVRGAVGKSGPFTMGAEYILVRTALELAGGVREDAAPRRAELRSSVPGRFDARKIDLDKIMLVGDLTENYRIYAGDILYVPRNRLDAFLDAAMRPLRPLRLLFGYSAAGREIYDLPDDIQDDEVRSYRSYY